MGEPPRRRDARLDPGRLTMGNLGALRRAVADANIALASSGLVVLSFGNVSGVERGEGVLVIKPSGVPYDTLTADDMVVVALDDGRVVEGTLRPSTDTPTHRLLYRELPDIGGIVHTHSREASAWAQAGRAIPCLGTTHADHFRGSVPVTRALQASEIDGDYEWETGRVIVETLAAEGRTARDAPAVLVDGHGPFCWGATPAGAVENAIALEHVAAIATRTLLVDPARGALSPRLLARHFDRKHGATAYYGQPGDRKDDP
jgi:L-ribulose-5-phosphate 4-epimerase